MKQNILQGKNTPLSETTSMGHLHFPKPFNVCKLYVEGNCTSRSYSCFNLSNVTTFQIMVCTRSDWRLPSVGKPKPRCLRCAVFPGFAARCQLRSAGRWRYRRQEARVRHLGRHGEPGEPDGDDRRGRPNTGHTDLCQCLCDLY